MNSLVTLACVLAVAGLSHGSAIGLGGLGLSPWGLGSPLVSKVIVAPAAVSTANLYKAAPIPVIRTIASPIITAPVLKTVVGPVGPILGPVGPVVGSWEGLGGGLGWGSGLGLGHKI